MQTSLAIITVVYKNYTVLNDFLHSLETQKNKQFHLFIADASPQRQPITSDTIKITVLPIKNLGYAHGVNEGVKKAITNGYTKFTVINDDTYFNEDFIQHITQSLTDHPSALIGGKIYYAPGYEYHKGKYDTKDLGKIIWYAGGIVDWDHIITHHKGVDELDKHQHDTFEKTEFITGCFMAFDKKVMKKQTAD